MKSIFIFILILFVTSHQIHGASFISEDQRLVLDNLNSRFKLNNESDTEEQKDWASVLGHVMPRYLQGLFAKNLNITVIRHQMTSWGVSDACVDHSTEVLYRVDLIVNQKQIQWIANSTWVLHMVDSYGKIPEGILSGHINALGDFDECVAIRASNVTYSGLDPIVEDPQDFRGRYCNVAFAPNMKDVPTTAKPRLDGAPESRISVSIEELLSYMSIVEGVILYPSLAMCFPSTCSNQDVNIILSGTFANQLMVPNILSCYTDQKPDFVKADYGVMGLLGAIGGIILIGTLMDFATSNKKDKKVLDPDEMPPIERPPGTFVKILLAFSIKTNVRKLLNTKTGPGDFRCLHGMRFLSTIWVVTAHTWYVTTFLPVWNEVDLKTSHQDWEVLTMINSHVSVDTFFILSGLLVTYGVLRILERNKGKLNFLPLFYVHRYLRLTPTYAILIGVMATLWPYFGSGPYWIIMDRWSQFCKDNWWTNLLYVNNLVNAKEMCYGEAWYLANDMQFYILSPLLIYPLWKFPVAGKVLMGLVTLGSVLSPGLLVHFLDSTPGTIATRNMGDWFYSVNVVPWARAQTYLVGMWMGYVLFRTKGAKIRIPFLVSLIGWLFFAAVMYCTLYSIYPYFDPKKEIPDVASFLYASLNKFGYALGAGWVIFACVHGYGGIVNTFLSWKAFIPLGRLTFSVYLISLHLQMILHLRFRQAITYDQYTMTNFAFAHVMMAFMLGFLCTVAMESPFIQVVKIILPVVGGEPQAPKKARPTKRYGIFYNSNAVIVNSFDVKEEDEKDNNGNNNNNVSNNKGETEKPEV